MEAKEEIYDDFALEEEVDLILSKPKAEEESLHKIQIKSV